MQNNFNYSQYLNLGNFASENPKPVSNQKAKWDLEDKRK